MSAFQPFVSPEIFTLRPDYRALSVHAAGVTNQVSDHTATEALLRACRDLDWAAWAHDHVEAWRKAFRAFGAKPQRTPCSAEALRKRVQRDGTLPASNAVVDLYNAVSLRYALPIGGENAAAYRGSPRLIMASGAEAFDTLQNGLPHVETPEPGEVVWCDDAGVTCRRWNWRQGLRTRIEPDTVEMWFILERLDPMPLDKLIEAGKQLESGLLLIAPNAQITQTLIDASQSFKF
jgi:DNA/RNA-binding domain of Phe-tRNA-synthetase-like protein